ncbi:bifunctional 5,10-methylenetetrahydrofolate dehydrogenase/5,10-methenyltetrahydrofolate cyclohydrolase [Dorea acetigenes]|uniref:Bifunctional protein FolD n=1 Tax=Dorea acetigenes TaxID=2981787 RepID=A0ABT2RKG8_9FIRM|nr:bifunctional 5,10-methylenetetrahydrofolate dehydrogenase/5,10-methenyltetrahydrofolate cyclohydrolase [Dorea acetigenes]MCB6414912.1 bifunctional 5,10-methylenetetrahydrofolate dehydrogenase/5,10-methenyltetrahydrofolate cyclohydrolase [Faecalimonas umbilicata]MCU6685907.1 bifunctional 5,10-methylenetetrahydrofolate dehydrogenase/5,10-methenyltetrahydrofolate cyclohydrolase [Dorea acetigenes]SCI69926.1 Bifunctional protein FolD [uncultured Clostridium sp.]
MSVLMKGADVANAMKEVLINKVEALKEEGTVPCLTIVRVGNRPDDLAYERGAKKRMEMTGITCRVLELPEKITQSEFEEEFRKVNDDPAVHGILLFRPLPKQLDEEPIKAMIHPEKDMDCMSPVNVAKVFAGDETGYAPCTAEAVMEMLDYYDIDPKGKNVTVVGRSMVVGKPLSMMLLKRHATITVCHTRTVNLMEICRGAEILVAAAGKARMITADMVGEGAVVADVGINVDEAGNLCGDVDFDAVEPKASYISPVPRGVGSITTSVLAKHVVRAAERASGK